MNQHIKKIKPINLRDLIRDPEWQKSIIADDPEVKFGYIKR
jgi:hypothetical protein